MKSTLLMKSAVVALALALVPSAVLANQIQVASGYGPYNTGAGGEFTFTVIGDWLDTSGYSAKTLVNGGFQTFCIETKETINQGQTYNAVLNQNAVAGGPGAGSSGDPISVGTGWLYSQFARGVLAGYNWDNTTNPGRSNGVGSSADLLQQAIWVLEDETHPSHHHPELRDPNNNIFLQAVVDKFGSLVDAKLDGGWNYGVYALNLTHPTTGALVQDALVYVPDGGLTLVLLGMAIAGLGVFARRQHV